MVDEVKVIIFIADLDSFREVLGARWPGNFTHINTIYIRHIPFLKERCYNFHKMNIVQVSLPLPPLPEGWAAPKNYKAIGHLSAPVQRNLEPVGPHFLAHARRVR